MKRGSVVLLVIGALAALVIATPRGRATAWAIVRPRSHTIASRLAQYGPVARARMAPAFAHAGVPYPPKALTLLGLKEERVLQVFAGSHPDSLRFIAEYPVRAASGTLGPKLRRGDNQVPEGVYRIESLNPNSRFHLSLRVNYPNAFDRQRAKSDGRDDLGGDIMIHGNSVSIGCLAMGDQAAEDLFVLAAETGLPGITVILAPLDPRRNPWPTSSPSLPSWTSSLYADIGAAIQTLPAVPSRGAS